MADQVPVRREQGPSTAMEGQVMQPWRDPADMFRDIDTVFNRMVRGFFDTPLAGRGGAFTPLVDIEETEDAYIIELELPGVRREDITIEAGQQELHIYGQITEKERTGILRHRTRRTGSFDYRVALPTGVDTERIQANYKDGILTVTVPRAEASKPRRISVE